MKITVFLFLSFIVSNLKAQIMIPDTIYVNTESVWISFLDDIEAIKFNPNANRENYDIKLKGNTVLIKEKEGFEGITTLVVQSGKEFYQGTLAHTKKIDRLVYDFRNITSEIVTTTKVTTKVNSDKENQPPLDTTTIITKERFNSFLDEPTQYKTLAEIHHNIFLSLANLRHDREFTYIRLKVTNKSNIIYNIDFTQFEIVEAGNVRNDIKILMENMEKVVNSKSDAILGFVLPLVSIPEKADLKITLREKNGLRTVTLNVPARIIGTAKTF